MLAEPEFGCNTAIGQTVGDERDHLLFAGRQQESAVGVDHAQGGHFG
ncbi:MAG TPA: hypothetical protein VIH78_16975 [Terriglobales bacterium]